MQGGSGGGGGGGGGGGVGGGWAALRGGCISFTDTDYAGKFVVFRCSKAQFASICKADYALENYSATFTTRFRWVIQA